MISPSLLPVSVEDFKSDFSSGATFPGIYRQVADLGTEIGKIDQTFKDKFQLAINNDLNAPQALASLFEVLKSSLSAADRLATIFDFDRILGLNLANAVQILTVFESTAPVEIQDLFDQRQVARRAGNFALADDLRQQLLAAGYQIEDGSSGSRLRQI